MQEFRTSLSPLSKGMANKLIYGTLAGKYVLLMSGRFHYYEGYPMQEVTFPIRIFHLLGIKKIDCL